MPAIRICIVYMYALSNLSILVNELGIFKVLGRFEVKIQDSRYEIKNKKKSILLQKCPFKSYIVHNRSISYKISAKNVVQIYFIALALPLKAAMCSGVLPE